MFKITLSTILTTITLMNPILSCNYKILDMHSDNITHKIRNGSLLNDEMLIRSINFVSNPDDVNQKYKEPEFIRNTISTLNDISDKSLTDFAFLCQSTYLQHDLSPAQKIGLNILFETVGKKLLKFKTLEKKIEMARNIPNVKSSYADADRTYDAFFKRI